MKKRDLIYLVRELERLDVAMLRGEADFSKYVDKVHPSNKKNAINLLHYLAQISGNFRIICIPMVYLPWPVQRVIFVASSLPFSNDWVGKLNFHPRYLLIIAVNCL
jgi:hypothetical protein